MFWWLIAYAVVLLLSAALLTVGAFRSARMHGGMGRGRLFDETARPWTLGALALLAMVVVGLIFLFA